MHLISTLLIPFAVLRGSIADINIATDPNYCPSCVGNKYIDTINNATGCCPIGYSFKGCVRDRPKFCGGYTGADSCPAADGQVFSTANGQYFKIQCGYGVAGATKSGTATDLLDCIEMGSKITGCQGVEWVSSDNSCWTRQSAGTSTVSSGSAQAVLVSGCPAPGPASTTNPACPGDDKKLYIKHGRTFTVQCDIRYTAVADKGNSMVSNTAECVDKCATDPTCTTSNFVNMGCWLYSSTAANQGTVSSPGSISFKESSQSTASAMSATDNCPALGHNQQTQRVEGGVTFAFSCGKYITGSPLKAIIAPHTVASLQACVQECAALPSCRGLHFGLSTAASNRVNECNLLGDNGAQTAGGVDASWVAAIAVGR